MAEDDVRIRGSAEVERSRLRQGYFAKWDGEKFLYGRAADDLRRRERPRQQEAPDGDQHG